MEVELSPVDRVGAAREVLERATVQLCGVDPPPQGGPFF